MQSGPSGWDAPKRRRKVRRTVGCNCKKSKCLKLYCECFGKQSFCGPECNCVECQNLDLPQFEENRSSAMSACFDRSSSFFGAPTPRKGCKCKRSQCAKNYCECFQAGLRCLDSCRCDDCGNVYGVKPSSSLCVSTDLSPLEEEKVSPTTALNMKKQRLRARLNELEKLKSQRIEFRKKQYEQAGVVGVYLEDKSLTALTTLEQVRTRAALSPTEVGNGPFTRSAADGNQPFTRLAGTDGSGNGPFTRSAAAAMSPRTTASPRPSASPRSSPKTMLLPPAP